MTARALFLLSPYRMPGQNTVSLANDDAAAFLNGYMALWHPAALWGATAPPIIGSPYDYEQPQPGHLYALPESPPLILPDDWEQRVAGAGAGFFKASADRADTLENLTQGLSLFKESSPEQSALLPLEQSKIAPFLGLGFGYLIMDTLFEAMQHEKLLNSTEFWAEIQQAVAALADADPDAFRKPLQAAADRLLAAREVLYPVTLHLLDLYLADVDRLDSLCPEVNQPVNVIASGSLVEKLAAADADRVVRLRQKVSDQDIEVCGGPYLEREDALLPVESQVWNLVKGQETYRQLLGAEVKVFARRRFAGHPHLPMLLQFAGIQKAVLLAFDDAVLPTHRATVINWPSPDGKQVEAFTRKPHEGDNPQTYFHLAHYLHQTIMQDHAATLALLHNQTAAPAFYHDWLELSRFAPVLGKWTTLSKYFSEVLAGEYASAASGDEFHSDYLTERTTAKDAAPVSAFANQIRRRRQIDTAWTLAALHRSLGPHAIESDEAVPLEDRLAALEDKTEAASGNVLGQSADPSDLANIDAALKDIHQETTNRLGQRLLAKALEGGPGYLVLNPCSFTRRVALEMSEITSPLPISGPIKACQIDNGMARLVIEVPPLGFAWFPQSGPPGTPAQSIRMRLADQNIVRNEFFEAEIDPVTGGLRGIRDHRTRVNRVAQQLVFQPGSTMRAKETRVLSRGPALGEVVSEGTIVDEHEQVLATFRQRFRAWLGRPLLEMHIEIRPTQAPVGYPWHAYYGARFAWRDEKAILVRGLNGLPNATTHTRPMTPDYLELRSGKQSTVLFPGGLPFHQRHGSRMLDVILITEGESASSFDLALALDRDQPSQTALGLATSVPFLATPSGPPHVGTTGWLFHLDVPNVLVFNLRPTAEKADAIMVRFLECANHSVQVELRCVRDPQRAHFTDARGNTLRDCTVQGDAVLFEVLPGDLSQLRVDFSSPV
ncbi:MAG: hypothetical protein ACJ8FY_15970 [Gemmataceae bacterium]